MDPQASAIRLAAVVVEQALYTVFDATNVLWQTEVLAQPLEDRKNSRALNGFVFERIMLCLAAMRSGPL